MQSVGAPGNGEAVFRVWDIGVRLFHWLLVATVAASLYTGFLAPRHWLDLHVISGTLVAGLLLYRVIWGLAGPVHARFSSFVVGPAAMVRHAVALIAGRAHRHIGHNPLGGAMIIVLLAVLAALVLTGALTLGGAVKEGPAAPYASYATGAASGGVHRALGFAMLGLIGLHVAGALVESLRTRENLVRAMIDGRKRAPTADDAPEAAGQGRTVVARPLAATLSFATATAALGTAIAALSLQPAFGVPTAALDVSYRKECGACHTPHHPSLGPAATWAAIMARLDDHFGENASLDEALTQQLGAYLAGNAAERWDTAGANRLRVPSPSEPLRITATEGWRGIHRGLEPQTFERKSVAGRFNCSNCHRDAESGRFAPRAIAVPEERSP